MTFLNSLPDRLGTLSPGYLLLAAAAILAAEVGLLLGVVLPAATTMLTVGLLARVGRLDLSTALAVTTLAALAGDQFGYLEGRLLGQRLRTGRLGRWVGEERWRRAEALIERRGWQAVLLGRWTAFARTLVPRVAGMVGLPYRRFLLFDAAAVVVWVPGTVLAGWAFGAMPAGLPVVGGLLVVVVVAAVAAVGRRACALRGRPARHSCRGPARGGRRLGRPAPGSRRPGAGRTAPARRGALNRS